MKKNIVIVMIILNILSACANDSNRSESMTNSTNLIENPTATMQQNSTDEDVFPSERVINRSIECHYYEPIEGLEEKIEVYIDDALLIDVLNTWLNELNSVDISYGLTDEGKEILEELKFLDAYSDGIHLTLVVDDVFIEFNSAYANPEYFVNALGNVLAEVTDFKSFTIQFSGKTSNIIGDDGIYIDNILIAKQERL